MEQELLVIKSCSEAGYHPLVFFEGWRVAILNDTPRFHPEEIKEMQRHNTSDEVFVLLEGKFTLYVAEGGDEGPGKVKEIELETGKLYCIPKGVWHTHVTAPGTKVLIVENADVSSENSDLAAIDLFSSLKEETTRFIHLKEQMEHNLETNILPFWREYMMDNVHGGFYGRVDAQRKPDLQSPKSVVLNCRILWTFCRTYALWGKDTDKMIADRAFDYICRYFWDETYKGVYWMVTGKGEVAEPEKRTYGQAFFLYSMAEYYRVFGNRRALELAMETFSLIERYLNLPGGGYRDSASRDWQKDDWVNFWVKNRTGALTLLNSNMHLFEAILTLAQVTKDPSVLQSLKQQLLFLLDTAMDWKCGHMKAAMAFDGSRLDGEINFGHDCECSYLIMEAAELLQEEKLLQKAEKAVETIINHVLGEGLDPQSGGMYYLADTQKPQVNRSKIWWVQAEGITAFIDRYQRTAKKIYLDAAVSIWNYVQTYMVNTEFGDWFSVGAEPEISSSGQQEEDISVVFTNDEMAGKGKCPYHNSRACLEIIKRAEKIIKK